ncbi:MAG: PCRF domain-containing protein [Candidatus Dojkabacteria bacterium]
MNEDIEKIKEKINLESLQESFDKHSAELGAITDFNSESYVMKIKEFNEAQELLEVFKLLTKFEDELKSNEEMINDPEMGDIAKEEKTRILEDLEKAISDIKRLTQKPLSHDERKAIIEIRPGVGGAEAGLFAEDLFKMYTKYCSIKGLKVDIFAIDYNSDGGIKEANFLVDEPGSFGLLRFESGIHRVQRVPKTEALGRIHTSTASVAVLPKFEAKDIKINPSDIRIDVYRSSGPGGQSVNTTDSAVRITHLPTKIIVTCQNGRSQIENKATAMSILASKLQDIEDRQYEEAENKIRGEAIGDADRSSKIRTYNFPQGRITDHRIGKSWFNIEPIMNGEIEDIINSTNTELRGN